MHYLNYNARKIILCYYFSIGSSEKVEEYVKALEEGNYQEARAGFQKIYDSTHSIIAFYYLTMIDYKFNGLKVNELLSRFEYLYGRGNPQIREKILPIYLTILLFEVDDF